MRCLVCVILFLLSTGLKAQQLNVTYTHLSPRDGLAGTQVYCALQDRQGYIWFGTETGVSRYNGRHFENFYTGDGLSDNEVFLMYQDSKDRIWFSTLNGQPSYYLDGKFHNASNTEWLKGLSFGAHFGSFFEDSTGTLWFSIQRKGIVRITPDEEFFRYDFERLENGQLLSFMEKEGQVWVVHSTLGEINLSELTPGAYLEGTETYSQGTPQPVVSPYIDSDETILVTGRHLFKSYLMGIDVNGNEEGLSKIQRYDDEIWLSTYKGAYQVSHESMLPNEHYFEDKIITHVLKDREGGYWFTTLGEGVFWVSSLNSRSLTNEQSGLLNGVSALNWNGERLLFGGSSAVVGVMENGDVSINQAEKFINRSMVKTIEEGTLPGQYILGSDNMFMEFINGKVTRSQWINAKLVKRVHEGLWALGTGNTLSIHTSNQLTQLLDLSEEEFIKVNPEKGHDDLAVFVFPEPVRVTSIATYNDGFMASTLDGLYIFDKAYNYTQWVHPDWEYRRVSDIAVFDNNEDFILATFGFGLSIFKDGKLTKITSKDGLRSDLCRKVLVEDDEHIWVATNRGISRLSWVEGYWDIENVRKSDGLASEDVHDLVLSDKLVAATSAGLSFIDLESLGQSRVKPMINIKALSLGTEVFATDSVTRKYSNDELKVHYEGIHFSSLDDLGYRYRVLGLNDRWTTTKNTALNLVRLSPGSYRFEVEAISHQGLSSETASVVIHIIAPFWWSWWFITSAALSLLAMTIAIHRLIIRKNRQRTEHEMAIQLRMSENEIKLLKAQMKPHFTYNILSSIQSLILKEDTHKAYEMIGEFAALMRKDLNAYDQTVITLGEELRLLETYLKLEHSRFDEGSWSYQIEVGKQVNQEVLAVPPMIIQPFAENALKHAFSRHDKTGKLNIKVDQVADWLEIEVSDNGPGLAKRLNGEHRSKGIEIVRKRLKLVDARNQVEVDNKQVEEGVRVSIKLKTK